MTQREALRRTGERLMESIASGDAAGLPVETKSFRYIEEHYGEISELLPSTGNKYFVGEYPPGTTSDDTEQSGADAEALVEAGEYDLDVIAKHEVRVFQTAPTYMLKSGRIKKLGYGTSTVTGLQNIADGISPHESGNKSGTGNGVIMKSGPNTFMQIAQDVSNEERYRQYDELTSMTHDNDVSRICTRVHGDVMKYLLTADYDEAQFVSVVNQSIAYHEGAFGTTSDISSTLNRLGDIVPGRDGVNCMRQWATEWALAGGAEDEEAFGKGYGFYVPQTLAFAYGSFMEGMHGNPEFSRTIYTAVNLGGDADSTASIAATMHNFATRGEFTALHDVEKIKDIDYLRKLSARLARVALNGK